LEQPTAILKIKSNTSEVRLRETLAFIKVTPEEVDPIVVV
jgi:hypothetical protein